MDDRRGGTVWGGIAYNPDLDLVFFGTGNPVVWLRPVRGEGDDLYTASIIAVKPSSGELAWHFQTTPGDSFDYDATQPLLQADLIVNGQRRKVILQANKNGFFSVLDRHTGEFLSGAAFVAGVNWASGLDARTGRPLEVPGIGDWNPEIVSPGPQGAHNWQPMAFHPETGLVYIPVRYGTRMLYTPDKNWKFNPSTYNIGADLHYEGPLRAKFGAMSAMSGELLAWDPTLEKPVWRAQYPVMEGGGLATGGNLVFQGRAKQPGIAQPTARNSGSPTPVPASWHRPLRIPWMANNT